MYKILRIPNNKDQFKKAYSLMLSYADTGSMKYEFNEFYRHAKEVYVISDGCHYHGAAAIVHKKYNNYELPYLFRSYGDNVYELLVYNFDNSANYVEIYDLIRTIIKDCNDRTIFIENIPNTNKTLLNALKNNKFKPNKGNDRKDYSQTLFCVPVGSKLIESGLSRIDPKDEVRVIDKMNDFWCIDEEHRIKEAQDQYTRDLIAKNIAETNKAFMDMNYNQDCCDQPQTAEQFLNEGHSCCHKCTRFSIDTESL